MCDAYDKNGNFIYGVFCDCAECSEGEVDTYEEDDCEGYGDDPFYDPGGHSALRAGARNLPCPTCGQPDRLTAADRRHGYQCDECADRAEGRFWEYDPFCV